MRKISTKQLIIIGSIFVVVLILSVFGATFAIFNYTRIGQNNTISTGQVDFNFTETLIDVANDFPQDGSISIEDLTVSEQNAHTGELTVSGYNTLTNGVEYRIYLVHGDDISGKTRMTDSSIKFQLEQNFTDGANGFTTLVNNYAEPTNLSFDNEGKALISRAIIRNTSQLTSVTYDYHMWIDGGAMNISSTTKRATLAEGNPSLADATSGNTTATRYMKNDSTSSSTVTLFPAKSNQVGKIIYTTYEFSTGYYNIKFLVEAINYDRAPICKRATTLHTETCNHGSSSDNHYCYADGYRLGGNKNTTTITYGTLGTTGTKPVTGNAFDCDVNGDGIYNPTTERFYYVSDYFDTDTKTFDNTTATLVHYCDYVNGSPVNPNNVGVSYFGNNSSYNNWHGPTVAISSLPNLTGNNAWQDGLLKTRSRKILSCNNTKCEELSNSTAGGTISYTSPIYDGKAARLLNLKEIVAGCNITSTSIYYGTAGELSNCNFLFERTGYANNNSDINGTWFENPMSSNSNTAWYLAADNRVVSNYFVYSVTVSARPTIDVNYTDIVY